MPSVLIPGQRRDAAGRSMISIADEEQVERRSAPILRPIETRSISLLTVGHATVDLCQGLVPAMVSYLVLRENYTYFMSASLVFATAAMSSIVQPVFGQMADRLKLHWLLPASVLLAGIPLGIGAQSPSYGLLLFALALSGFGIAAFHPEAARQAHLAAGDYRTTAMSYFSLGGSIGFAMAPALGWWLLESNGRLGMLWVMLPAAIVAALLARQFSMSASPSRQRPQVAIAPAKDDWYGFGVLTISVVARSIVFFAINTFLALYWRQRWADAGNSASVESFDLNVILSSGTTILSVFLGAGIGGTILGGWFADRFSRRATLITGFGLSMLTFPLMVWSPSMELGAAMVALTAVLFFAPASPAVVLGQEYLPNRVGMASGVTIGLAVSVGGMVVPLLGWLGDVYGLGVVFLLMEVMLGFCVISSIALPNPHFSTRLVKT